MKDPLTLTNPIERMNDLINLSEQQVVVSPLDWRATARALMIYYATHYTPRKDASA